MTAIEIIYFMAKLMGQDYRENGMTNFKNEIYLIAMLDVFHNW